MPCVSTWPAFSLTLTASYYSTFLSNVNQITDDSNLITEEILQELLTTVKKLKTDVAALQNCNGATGGTIPLTNSSHATLPQNGSKASSSYSLIVQIVLTLYKQFINLLVLHHIKNKISLLYCRKAGIWLHPCYTGQVFHTSGKQKLHIVKVVVMMG